MTETFSKKHKKEDVSIEGSLSYYIAGENQLHAIEKMLYKIRTL